MQFGSCAEKDSLSGTVMMVWIKASHKLLPRLTQKKCCTVYLLNLIHEFTSFFSTKVIYAATPKKTFPWKQAFVIDRKQGVRFAQGQTKGMHKGYFQMKELNRTTRHSYCRGEWEMRSSCRGDSLLPFGNW